MTSGRLTDYSEDKALYMCEMIASTPKSVMELCETDDNFPHESNFYRWLMRHDSFREKYLQAKEIQAIAFAERVIKDIYNCPAISEEIALRTLQMRGVQWHNSKLAAKYFGDKKQIESTVNANVKVWEDTLEHLK